MRKTLIAIVLGLTALAAAACGNSGSGSSAGTDTGASAAPLESASEAPLESPSDMLESPSESAASS
jgi:ABC-type glycerol-3-phosphate transport system substrate-binding protein